MPAGSSSALTLTPSMDSTMTKAASSAVHSLEVMIAPETLWSRPPCRAGHFRRNAHHRQIHFGARTDARILTRHGLTVALNFPGSSERDAPCLFASVPLSSRVSPASEQGHPAPKVTMLSNMVWLNHNILMP